MKLSITNFQSIENISIDVNGFTVIQGASDIGKSAIRRAVNLIMSNSWSPANLRDGAKNATVSLDDGTNQITRTKGSENSCTINGVTYNKLGITVPEEYADIGIKPFKTTDGEHNILVHSQFEPLFLLAMSVHEQHKIINSILGTSLYEDALRLCQKDLNQQQLALNNATVQKEEIDLLVEQSQKEIDLIQSAIDSEMKITMIKEFFESINQAQTKKSELSCLKKTSEATEKYIDSLSLVTDYSVATKDVEECTHKNDVMINTLSLLTKIDDALSYAYQVNKVMGLTANSNKLNEAVRIVDSLIGMGEMIADTSDFIKASTQIVPLKNSHSQNERSLEQVNSLIASAEKILLGKSYLSALKSGNKKKALDSALESVKKLGLLTAYLNNIASANEYQLKLDNDKTALTLIESSITLIAQSTPKVCPTCNRPWEK